MKVDLAVYRGVRALVLGASGFIGRWVARDLSRAGAHVISAVRDPASFAAIAAAWRITGDVVRLDATDVDAVAAVVRQVEASILFNLAGYGVDRSEIDPDLMQRLNVDLPASLIESSGALPPSTAWPGRRVVHVGSALEYGLVRGIAHEQQVCEPHTPYGQTKLAGTQAVLAAAEQAGLAATTVRLFTVYGPGEHPGRLLPTLQKAAATGEPVRLSPGAQSRDFTAVDDVALGLLAVGLSSGPPGEIVNLATGRMTTVRSFAESAAAVLGIPADRLRFGTEPLRADEMQIAGVDVSRLASLTGWTPSTDLAASISRVVRFDGSRERSA